MNQKTNKQQQQKTWLLSRYNISWPDLLLSSLQMFKVTFHVLPELLLSDVPGQMLRVLRCICSQVLLNWLLLWMALMLTCSAGLPAESPDFSLLPLAPPSSLDVFSPYFPVLQISWWGCPVLLKRTPDLKIIECLPLVVTRDLCHLELLFNSHYCISQLLVSPTGL